MVLLDILMILCFLLLVYRSAMAQMIKICEEFGTMNNLKFSTDPSPAKSKTKCLYMCGPRVRNLVYPAPLKLYDRELPWVTHATHLGHELHQDCNMDMDIRMKRAAFIKNSTDIRDLFSFALPGQILGAIQTYSCHFYGSMLWDLFSGMANQVYRSWNTAVKLVWDLPRATHNFFVEHLLALDLRSARQQVLSQYIGFLGGLARSVSIEVRIMASITAQDVRSNTGRNCRNLELEFSQEPWSWSPSSFNEVYKQYELAEQDRWRISYLRDLLYQREDMKACDENTDVVTNLIESLCIS